MFIIVIGGVRSNERGRKSGRLRINLPRGCFQEREGSLGFIHKAILIENCPGDQLHRFLEIHCCLYVLNTYGRGTMKAISLRRTEPKVSTIR